MPNEPLKGVAPQVQRPVVPQPATAAPAVPAATEQVAPVAPVISEPAVVEPIKERTQENFEKLLESNNRLFQQQQAQSVLIQQLLQQQQRSAPQVPQVPQAPTAPFTQPQQRQTATATPSADILADFIVKDPTTGEEYIDRQKMQQTLSSIQQEALQARQLAQRAEQQAQQQERIRQEREAFNSYAELNPRSGKYDMDFVKKTRAFMTDSMLNQDDYGGRSLTLKEAADLVRAGANPTQQQVATAAVAQAIEEQQQAVNAAPTANQINKAQAAASVANQPQQSQSELSEEQLRSQQVRTRQGDDQALAERLMHTEHIFGPNSISGTETQ